ncbi:hypothetical protein G6F24_018010 [Rhizopus arrhizus]|nr:hypothetical protein G6F24_018010 [Rhizopus arrhizus]
MPCGLVLRRNADRVLQWPQRGGVGMEHHLHVTALGGTQHRFVAPDVLFVEGGVGFLGLDDHRFTTLADRIEEGGVEEVAEEDVEHRQREHHPVYNAGTAYSN